MKQIKKFFKGFKHASRGVIEGFRESNMRIHGLVAIAVMILGFVFQLNATKWAIILILIAVVWSAELVNTAIEDLSNLVRDTEKLSYMATKNVRDLAAGSVLVIAIAAAIIGALIFLFN